MDTNREIIEEKDEKIAQLERQLLELKEAQQQIAATIALGQNSRYLSSPKGIFNSFLKTGGSKIILAMVTLVFLVVMTSVGIRLFAGSTFKQESVTFVEHVQELNTLATAEAHMKAVLHEVDNKKIFWSINLPGTKRELLLVVPATVIAGVDLKGITSEDMLINEETKEIDITLPHAKLIQDPTLQMDKIQAIDNSGIFRGDVKWDEGFDLTAKAQKQIRQDAISSGLLVTAEKNAEKALTEFFKNIGYTVNVTFN
ncbi:DUF4230 domain-containing protein [Metabacillus halosaccharovorans]|uniref:DUF4230 domain-containing protein n=1 Tax=Metabacillus halosaccharovorans TaxID=930124 RepID=UPI00203C1D54|nr:DUF4230 domain-containing protein [Metabacillus halosaccharovorans]MCM3439347.1 DUF4230 domain-containing protein [Metabacillus halosaccharovorans]